MYKYKNSFKNYDEAKYPYGMEFVKENVYENFCGKCNEKGFNINADGAKHLFATPKLQYFKFSSKVIFSHYRAPFRTLRFGVVIGYDKETKQGYEVQFDYMYAEKVLTASLIRYNGSKRVTLQEKKFENADIVYHKATNLSFVCDESGLHGSLGNFDFDFALETPRGRVGISVSYVSEGIVFANAQITSNDNFNKKKVLSRKFTLPKINGGILPYTIAIEVISLGDGAYELKYKLDGGSNAVPIRDTYTNVWCLSHDDITNMYIKTIHNGEAKKYYLFNGKVRFTEKNLRKVFYDFFEQIFTTKEVPLKGNFNIIDFPEDALLCIGYEHFNSIDYMKMEGASEFIYDKNCNLLYCGEPLEKDIITRLSSVDKKIIKRLPKTLWHYDEAVRHAERNHYFFTDEIPKFSLKIFSKLNFRYITAKATLEDAFFTKIKEIKADLPTEEEFSVLDYKCASISFKLPKLALGVYHISVDVYYGDSIITTHNSALEVMDENSDISPQEASKLPYMHLGDGEPNLVYTGAPDLYSEAYECDFDHYFRLALIPPIPAEEMRVWEIMKFYKRELFSWLTIRTTLNYDLSKLKNLMSNNHHMHPNTPGCYDLHRSVPHRYDSYRYSSYGKNMRAWLNEFLAEHPDYKKNLGIEDAFKEFTHEQFVNLLKLYGTEWVDFTLPRIRQLYLDQNAELRKNNPAFKRSGYGPWSTYQAPYFGGYVTKWFGYDIEKLDEIYEGFMQFEDYPYSCAYRTTKGAWTLMTMKILNPKLHIHPELYFNFPEACPDLAVSCAYPPFGDSVCPPHFTMTQICEYVYNTAYVKDGKFDYWRDNGFAPLHFIHDNKKRMRVILSLWKQVLENKPIKPLKTTLFVYDINKNEDRHDFDVKEGHFYNISESNLSYLYDLMKSNGIPAGFGAKFGEILTVSENDVSAIVLPDMTNASKEVIMKLRELHKKGVSLIAVSRVGELSDIFGVKENYRSADVNCLSFGKDKENILPYKAEFFHENVSGNMLLTANEDIPVVIEKGNTILLNTSIEQVGIDNLATIDYQGRPNISRLLAKTLKECTCKTINSIAKSDDRTGISFVKTENGDTLLILTDYSKYSQDNIDIPALHEVHFNTDEFKNIEYINVCNDDIKLSHMYDGDILRGISVMIRPQETLIFKLIEV